MFFKIITDYINVKTKYLLTIFSFLTFISSISANNPLTLTCPENLTVQLAPCELDTLLYYDSLVWSSAVSLVDTTFNPPSGSLFSIGATTVSLAVLDENGNLETCNFEITILEQFNSQLACNNTVEVTLSNDCQLEIIPEMLLEGIGGYCYDDIDFNFSNPYPNANPPAISPYLTIENIGHIYQFTVVHTPTGNSCWGQITADFKLDPEIVCQDQTTIFCHQPKEPEFTGTPEILNPCFPIETYNFNYSDNIIIGGCDSSFSFKINRYWIISDQVGNQSNCLQEITLQRFEFSDIDFPQNLDNIELPALDCSGALSTLEMTDTSITGRPMVDGFLVENPQCEFSFTYTDSVSQICGNSFEIKRKWRAINWCINDFIFHTQTIIIQDNTVPEFAIPDTIFSSLSINCDDEIMISPVEVLAECSDFDVLITTPFGNINADGGIVDFPIDFGSHNITYEVTDSCGNISSQNAIWQISQDELLDCPENVTIDCDNYYDNYEQELSNNNYSVLEDFGTIDFYENCDFEVTDSVEISLDNCGSGAITRIINTPNLTNPYQCEQTINIEHKSDLVVIFPDDIFENCSDQPLDFGEPIIIGENCEQVAVLFEDQLFTTIPDACYKIVRQWTIINTCIGNTMSQQIVELSECESGEDYDGNGENCILNNPLGNNGVIVGASHRTFREDLLNPDGYITYEQVIKVNDTVDPIFQNCQLPDIITNCDEDIYISMEDLEITDCYQDLTITVESATLPGGANGFGPFSNVPPGNYTVVFKATDICGNWSVCETILKVIDQTPPEAYCVDGLVVDVMNTNPPATSLWIDDFDAGSFDNCGAIQLSFFENEVQEQLVFDCCQIGEFPIQVWATDLSGNQSFCETFVVIQNNLINCDCYDFIFGNILTEENEGVNDVEITLSENGNVFDITYTNENGSFQSFDMFENIKITPEKNINPLNGVSTFDGVLILKHVLNIETIESPYKLIAADINNSQSITTFDMVALRKVVLGMDDNFQNNQSWRFVDADFEFPNPANPWHTPFPETTDVDWNDPFSTDFIGIKIGDINLNANSQNLTSIDDRNFEESTSISIDNQSFKKGELIKIPFYLNNNNLAGFQFSMNFDVNTFEFESIQYGILEKENLGLNQIELGTILLSWDKFSSDKQELESLLFTLKLRANSNGQLSENLFITNSSIVNEAFDKDDKFYKMKFDWIEKTDLLSENIPNPFSEKTYFELNLENKETVQIQIMDSSGKLISKTEQYFEKGNHKIKISKNDFPSTGIYFFQLKTSKENFIRKMLLTD